MRLFKTRQILSELLVSALIFSIGLLTRNARADGSEINPL